MSARSRWPCGRSPAGAHDGDDLLDGWRIGRIAQPLVARRAPRAEPGQRRGRTAPTGHIEQHLGHDPSSGSTTSPEHHRAPEQYAGFDCRFPSARQRRRTALDVHRAPGSHGKRKRLASPVGARRRAVLTHSPVRPTDGQRRLTGVVGGHLDTVSFVMNYVEVRIGYSVFRALRGRRVDYDNRGELSRAGPQPAP